MEVLFQFICSYKTEAMRGSFVIYIIIVVCMVKEKAAGITMCNSSVVCPGKTCQSDGFSVKCVCDESSIDPSCVLTSTASVVSETACTCVHGNCTVNLYSQQKCICDMGWSGRNCSVKCSLVCTVGQRCEKIPDLDFAYCAPIESVAITTTPSNNSTTSGFNVNGTYNACDTNYLGRLNTECQIPCKYGQCRQNGSRFSCKCDEGAFGSFCQTKCCKNCGKHGTCYFYAEKNLELCNCAVNYTGPYCEKFSPPQTYKDPEKVTWYFWLAGACAFVLLILIVVIVVIPYILWRNRAIFVMRVVHYFQKYEDEDDRQWDAFVSYKSNTADEQFVVNKLCVKLERELGFKLNIHFRDFLPGETIANNIISAVQGSRRTILVISPKYVTSEFTKLEYQVAQQEMLKRKHRIIPILLEDISEVKDTMDPNLKVILNSVTYIEWPTDETEKKVNKFWQRMEFSLPKKNKRFYDTDLKMSFGNINGNIKPSSIDIAVVDLEKTKDVYVNKNVYTPKNESELAVDEVYDTLNENEMDGICIYK